MSASKEFQSSQSDKTKGETRPSVFVASVLSWSLAKPTFLSSKYASWQILSLNFSSKVFGQQWHRDFELNRKFEYHFVLFFVVVVVFFLERKEDQQKLKVLQKWFQFYQCSAEVLFWMAKVCGQQYGIAQYRPETEYCHVRQTGTVVWSTNIWCKVKCCTVSVSYTHLTLPTRRTV